MGSTQPEAHYQWLACQKKNMFITNFRHAAPEHYDVVDLSQTTWKKWPRIYRVSGLIYFVIYLFIYLTIDLLDYTYI